MNQDFDAMMEAFFNGVDTVFGSVVRFIGMIVEPTIAPYLSNVWVRLVLALIFCRLVSYLMFTNKHSRYFSTEFELRFQFCPMQATLAMTLFALDPEQAMTFQNYAEWESDAYGTLIIMLFVYILTSVLYGWLGIGHLIRFWSGMIMFALLTSLYVDLRDWINLLLEEHYMKFIWSILYMVTFVLEGLPFILLLVGLFACYAPSKVVKACSEGMNRAFSNAPDTSNNSAKTDTLFPSYARNAGGDTLNVSIRDDYLIIDTPSGEKSVRYEYVKGQDHVNIDGEKYYINYR